MPYGEIGRGLNDLAGYILNGSDVPGAKFDIPGARSLQWQTDVDSDDIGGDDVILAKSFSAKSGSGSVETAKTNLTALAAMMGSTATTSGTTPNEIITMEETSAANQTYLQFKGQALSQDKAGSAYEITIAKAKVGGIQETLEYDAWHTPQMDFEFLERGDGKFLTRKLMETRVALA